MFDRFASSVLDVFAPRGPKWTPTGLITFRTVLLVHAAVRLWGRVGFDPMESRGWFSVVLAGVATLAAGAGLIPKQARRAAGVAAVATLLDIVTDFAQAANHVYLELYCLALCASLNPEDKSEGALLRSALCWMSVLVLFHSGLQKLTHGYYFHGDFLLTAIAGHERFATPFAWLLPVGEVERLQEFDAFLTGAGPFYVESIPLIIASNGVWATELILPLLIVLWPTRTFAAWAAIALVVGFQIVAREFIFALLFAQLLLLALPGEWNRRLIGPFLAAYAILVMVMLGLLPEDLFTREGQL